MANLIWHPLVDFENVIKSEKKGIVGDGQKTFVNIPYEDQNMFYHEILQVTFSCQFDLDDFPFDSHECNFTFGDLLWGTFALIFNSSTISYGKNKTSLGDLPIVLNDFSLPFDFELQSLPAFEEIKNGRSYSYTGMKILIQRKQMGYLLAGYYYPTTAFALLSMISFLIHPECVSTIFI